MFQICVICSDSAVRVETHRRFRTVVLFPGGRALSRCVRLCMWLGVCVCGVEGPLHLQKLKHIFFFFISGAVCPSGYQLMRCLDDRLANILAHSWRTPLMFRSRPDTSLRRRKRFICSWRLMFSTGSEGRLCKKDDWSCLQK